MFLNKGLLNKDLTSNKTIPPNKCNSCYRFYLLYSVYYKERRKGMTKMIEKLYKMTLGDDRIVEKVIQDDNIHYIHMIFNKDEGLPEHFSNSTVYMTVLRGKLSLGLGEQEIKKYEASTVIKIPFNTKMNVKNLDSEVLELIVIKAPAPQK